MSAGARRYEDRTQEVSAISRGLKALAKKLHAPAAALLQGHQKHAAAITARNSLISVNRDRLSRTPMS